MVESVLIDNRPNLKLYDLQKVQPQGDAWDIFEEGINLFIEAIEETNNLRIVGTSFNKAGKEIFLIEDVNSDGHIEAAISEIIEKVKNIKIAREFVRVIEGERAPIILNGITRVVGYFSKINNWNRSKIGELKDRRRGEYSVGCCK